MFRCTTNTTSCSQQSTQRHTWTKCDVTNSGSRRKRLVPKWSLLAENKVLQQTLAGETKKISKCFLTFQGLRRLTHSRSRWGNLFNCRFSTGTTISREVNQDLKHCWINLISKHIIYCCRFNSLFSRHLKMAAQETRKAEELMRMST